MGANMQVKEVKETEVKVPIKEGDRVVGYRWRLSGSEQLRNDRFEKEWGLVDSRGRQLQVLAERSTQGDYMIHSGERL